MPAPAPCIFWEAPAGVWHHVAMLLPLQKGCVHWSTCQLSCTKRQHQPSSVHAPSCQTATAPFLCGVYGPTTKPLLNPSYVALSLCSSSLSAGWTPATQLTPATSLCTAQVTPLNCKLLNPSAVACACVQFKPERWLNPSYHAPELTPACVHPRLRLYIAIYSTIPLLPCPSAVQA
jgi:hypothetical protein